jgi:hypothetical protein
MNRKVGKVSWDSPTFNRGEKGDKKKDKKVPFLQLKGNNKSWKLRVVSEEPIRYWCHWTTNSKGEATKVNCTLDETCPVHNEKTKSMCAGQGAQSRFYLKVIDRTDNSIKVLDVGTQIISAIGELHNNEDWGHCNGYDITIKKGAQGQNPLYAVMPGSKKPLTAEEKQLVLNSEDPDHDDFVDLESKVQPMSAASIRRILDMKDEEEQKKPADVESESETVEDLKDKEEDFDVNWED